MEVKDRQDEGKRIRRYSSIKALLLDHMEVVAKAKYAKTCAGLYVSLDWIAPALQLEGLETEFARLPKNGADTCSVGITIHHKLDTTTSSS